jgi:hypothetical protein
MSVMKQAVVFSCVTMVVVACGSAATPSAGTIETPSATPIVPSPSPTPLATAVRSARATWTTTAQTSDIVAHLRAAGLTVSSRAALPGSTPITLFGAESTEQLSVENERVTVYSFSTADQAENVFQLVSQRRETVTWSATPYFVKIASNLAVLTTMSEAAARRVVDALVR